MQTTNQLIKRISSRYLPIFGISIFFILLAIFFSTKQAFISSSCKNPTSVDDFTVSKNEVVRICEDQIKRGQTVVVSRNEYSDLFEYSPKEGKSEPTQQYVKVFTKDNNEYVSIVSVMDYSSWFSSAIGIYQKDKNSYKQVFRQSYLDGRFGRWTRIDLLNMPGIEDQSTIAVSGDLGYLGCLGCRINWTDYYDWDNNQKTYILANNKHTDKFQELQTEYEKTDKEACSSEIPPQPTKVISEIYQIRKDSEHFCDDGSISPLITPPQAETFLKAKRTIERIISGENLSNQDVSKIVI